MRLTVSNDSEYNATVITADVDCNTDATPLLSRVMVFGMMCNNSSPMTALAAVCFFHRYCGEQINFDSIRIGANHLTGIRHIVGSSVNVSTVDGRYNKLSDKSIDMLVCQDDQAGRRLPTDGANTSKRIIWGGIL